jgi:hypothetical protein
MSQKEQPQPPVEELNSNTLNLKDFQQVNAIIEDNNNKRRQISTARD